jgi:hypothetical protein
VEPKVVLLDRDSGDEALSSVEPLDVRNVDSTGFAEILNRCRTTDLRVYHIKVSSLEGIERLRSPTSLTLDWATKVTTLSPVFKMRGLAALQVIDFPRLANVAGIEGLTALRRLVLAGGMWKPLRLESVRPVCALRDLEEFTLLNTRVTDDDITCLAGLRHLTSLTLANQFDRVQVAKLARHLNAQLSTPLTASTLSSLACATCGGGKHMFTGRRMPFLCRQCEPERFERLTSEFEALVRSF